MIQQSHACMLRLNSSDTKQVKLETGRRSGPQNVMAADSSLETEQNLRNRHPIALHHRTRFASGQYGCVRSVRLKCSDQTPSSRSGPVRWGTRTCCAFRDADICPHGTFSCSREPGTRTTPCCTIVVAQVGAAVKTVTGALDNQGNRERDHVVAVPLVANAKVAISYENGRPEDPRIVRVPGLDGVLSVPPASNGMKRWIVRSCPVRVYFESGQASYDVGGDPNKDGGPISVRVLWVHKVSC